SVLTSGGHPSVLDAAATITRMVRQAEGSTCTVLAGSGLTVDAVGDFVRATGVRAVHFGSGVRPRGEVLAPVDEVLVAKVRATIDGAASHV
ncbi:copper homeostasis protein CutC, partial [Burkholderia stabilis]